MHKVLVAEDDDSVWYVLELILKSVPCAPERAKSGQTALELLQKGGFDAAVLDLMLPEMHGDEILARLNEDPRFKGFPILVDSSIAGGKWKTDAIKSFKNLRIEISIRPADVLVTIQTMRRLLGLPVQDSFIEVRAQVKKKVLIVDDDDTIRQMYLPFFKGKGYEATAASDGNAALESLQQEPIDLMILDLNMPEMSGEEVMVAMAKHPRWKNIPIIIDTSLRSSSERVKKINADFSGKLRYEFFQRPTELQDLSDAIQRILII